MGLFPCTGPYVDLTWLIVKQCHKPPIFWWLKSHPFMVKLGWLILLLTHWHVRYLDFRYLNCFLHSQDAGLGMHKSFRSRTLLLLAQQKSLPPQTPPNPIPPSRIWRLLQAIIATGWGLWVMAVWFVNPYEYYSSIPIWSIWLWVKTLVSGWYPKKIANGWLFSHSPKPSPYGLAEDEVDCLATRSQADQKPSSELFIFSGSYRNSQTDRFK